MNRYIEYSKRLTKLNSLPEISALLSMMLDQNVLPDTVIMNQLIKKMNQLKQIDFVLELHGIAATRHIANAITYNSTITAIAKSASPDAKRALSLLDEAAHLFNCPDMTCGSFIDLHGLSYGAVYFGLIRRLKTELRNTHSAAINLQIIYGQGLHRHATSVAGTHPLKEALHRVMREMSREGVSGEENPKNPGQFSLRINPHVQSAQHQSGALTQHSLFPSTRNTSLNPNAHVFVPRSFAGKPN